MGRLRIKVKKKDGRDRPPAQGTPPPVDPRALEKSIGEIHRLMEGKKFNSIDEANAFLQEALSPGKPLDAPPRTPLEKAQEVMYRAWDATGRKRTDLARKALGISADCADAYVLLAEETARSLEEAMGLYEQGVKAGERALGAQAFKDYEGDFWGILETRPYMPARAGLAECLWMLGRREEAIAHYTDMLRLNPNDNQGLRYLLAQHLVEEKKDEAFVKLLHQFPDEGGASWLYTRALWAFRREGEGKKANAFLREAAKVNRFVPAYLLGRKKLPDQMPAFIGWGDDSEAVEYAAEALDLWRNTEGALDWLNRTLS